MYVAAAYRAVWDRLRFDGVACPPPDPIYSLRSSRREQVADRSPARCAAALSVTTVWAGAQRLVRAATPDSGKTVRARSDRRRRRFATDAPATWLST
jgi:hypothetical protein